MKNEEFLPKLVEIGSQGLYSQLSAFVDPKLWRVMSRPERELLGTLFVMQGSQLALEDTTEALKCFRLAAKAAPSSPQVFYRIGEAYVGMGESPRTLRAACRSFAKAVNLNPEYYEAWAAYALTETRFGEMNQDIGNFIQADEKYQKAFELLSTKKDTNPGSLCWKWGGLWYRIAKLSGEPNDFHRAIQKFTIAKGYVIDDPNFLNDFGNLLAEQAMLLGSQDLFEKAIFEYEECISKNPKHASAYLNLGCTCMRLLETTAIPHYFEKGDQAFRASSEIDPHQGALWLFWGMLELTHAKRGLGSEEERREHFLSAVKKFEVADLCEPDHAIVMLKWGEALMYLSGFEENCLYLKEALEKIKKSLKKEPDRPDSWYFHGKILAELGSYFQDERICLEAKEKYHRGLKIDPGFVAFHYGIAEVCMELTEITENIKYLEEASRHFKKVTGSAQELPPQFWLDYGMMHLRLGEARKDLAEVEASRVLFEKALVYCDENRATPFALDILFHYATAISIIGNLTDDPQGVEKGVRLLSQILHENPHYSIARLQYALSLQHLGEMVSDVDILRESIVNYEIAINSDPEDDLAWNGLGVSLISLSEMLDDPMHQEESADLKRKAELNLLHAASLGCDEAYYSLACLFSLSNNLEESLYFLEKASTKGSLPPIDEIMNDEWLSNIRSTEQFRRLITGLINNDGEDDFSKGSFSF